jgi:hypothetical protein
LNRCNTGAFIGLPEDVNQREPSCAFHHGMEDCKIKQPLIMGGERSLNEALNQALKLEIAKVAGRSSAKLRKVRTGAPM